MHLFYLYLLQKHLQEAVLDYHEGVISGFFHPASKLLHSDEVKALYEHTQERQRSYLPIYIS